MEIITRIPSTLAKPSKSELGRWHKLAMSKYRRREGLFLAEGLKVLEELWKSRWQIDALLGMAGREDIYSRFFSPSSGYTDTGKAISGAGIAEGSSTVQRYILSEKEWGKLSRDRTPEGVMAVVKIPAPGNWQMRLQEAPGHILLVDGINNPNNLGAIMRTAHWFGFAMVLLSTGAVDWTHPKVVRASMGSIFHLEIFDNLSFHEILPVIRTNHLLIGSDVRSGVPPHRQAGRTALLLGSESHGVPKEFLEMINEQWHIPGAGRAESLSLPQAAAIMMYELTKGSMHGRVSPDHHNH